MLGNRRGDDSEYAWFERLIISFGIGLLSLLFWTLIWLMVGMWMVRTDADAAPPFWPVTALSIGLALLGMIKPELAADALAWLFDSLHRVAKWWTE